MNKSCYRKPQAVKDLERLAHDRFRTEHPNFPEYAIPPQSYRDDTANGSADISATIAGRSVKMEIKIGADRQSEAQRRYQVAIERAGGLYVIVKDFTSFVEWYGVTFNRG